MRKLTVVVCLGMVVLGCVSGCGSAGASSTSGNSLAENVTMQGGQWEFAVTPDSGGVAMFFGANLPMTSVNFSPNNTVIFEPSQITLTQNVAPIVCQGYSISGVIGGTKIEGQFTTETSELASFSGLLSPNGEAISDGKYSGQTCGSTSKVHGTLTGYTVPPVSGTYTGKLSSSVYGSDVITVAFTQNADFSLNVMGTLVENGVTNTFTNETGPGMSYVEGGSIFFTADTLNVNGKSKFSMMGHLNPAENQFDVYLSGANETAIGTLTKQ